MKYILTVLVASFALQLVQAQAIEAKVEYQKKDQDAFMIEFPYPPSVVEDAILERMAKMGLKAKESKGFRNFKETVLTQISSEKLDYILRVERKSRKEKDESQVYLLIYKGDGNLFSIMDESLKQNARFFLNDLAPYVEAYNLEVEIKKQEDEVVKAEKKQSGLEDDLKSLENKKKKLEEDMEENKKDQEKQKQEIEKQKQVLDAMKSKRKS